MIRTCSGFPFWSGVGVHPTGFARLRNGFARFRKAPHRLRKLSQRLRKGFARASEGFARNSQGFARLSQGFARASQVLRKASQEFHKISQGLRKASQGLHKGKRRCKSFMEGSGCSKMLGASPKAGNQHWPSSTGFQAWVMAPGKYYFLGLTPDGAALFLNLSLYLNSQSCPTMALVKFTRMQKSLFLVKKQILWGGQKLS